MADRINILIWNEYYHETHNDYVRKIYPEGIHGQLKKKLEGEKDFNISTATLDEEPDHGLTQEVLDGTDVLIWWGHVKHEDVKDEVVERVHRRILSGMGFIGLHSTHLSKVFRRLMGTRCTLRWREDSNHERVWVVEPYHPIARGLGQYFEIPSTEMYGEHFDVPKPDDVVFISWFAGGEVFRSGITYTRGRGKIFYFRPGHEANPVYYNDDCVTVIKNAIRWVRFDGSTSVLDGTLEVEPLEDIEIKTPEEAAMDHPDWSDY